MFTDYVLSENDKSDIRLHQTSLIVINSLIIIGKYEVFRWNRGGLIMGLNVRHEFITYHIINKSGILSILYDKLCYNSNNRSANGA